MTTFTQGYPIIPVPSLPNLMGGTKFPMYAGLPVFPGMQISPYPEALVPSAFTPAIKIEKALYTQSELDMLLYGYTKSKALAASDGDHTFSGTSHVLSGTSHVLSGTSHALSGLCLSDIKCGGGGDKGGSKVSSKTAHPVVDNSSLPPGVAIKYLTFAGIQHSSVFTTAPFKKGDRFGPFQGKNVYASEIKTDDGNAYMWEVFSEGKLKCFVDGRGAAGSWMSYVNCARYSLEQNLNAIQVDGEIFYEAARDIPEGKELLVWYGETYNMFMGIPIGLKGDDIIQSGDRQISTESNNESAGYSCERCGKVFAYKYYKDKHLKYTRCVDQGDRKFPCNLCSRSFEKRDRLRIHILHVHEKHRPHKCSVCNKCFSQSSSLNKHMRVHSGERPYKCVYCNKAFTASSILRTHIRQHSGEKPFKCKFCGKAFASHAAHDSHVRRTHTKEKLNSESLTCKICQEKFSDSYELTSHMSNAHSELPAASRSTATAECSTCGDNFCTPNDLYLHSYYCLASPLTSSPSEASIDKEDNSITGNSSNRKEEIDVVG